MFEIGQKVTVRHKDALDRVTVYQGKVVEKVGDCWRVDIGGVAVVFMQEDVHAEQQSHGEVQSGKAP
jgi:ribosome maturation factor RimP